MPDGTTMLVDGGGRPTLNSARRAKDADGGRESFEA